MRQGHMYINNADEAMLEYYRVFAKKNKVFATLAQIIRFLSSIRVTKNSELLFVTVGTGIATCALYKYLK